MLKKFLIIAVLCITGTAHAALNIQHWTLPNGTRVYFVENHTIPILDVNVDFDAGGRRDPAGKSGMASLTNAMLARGIAASTLADGSTEPAMSESQISDAIADIAAQRGGGAGTVAGSCFRGRPRAGAGPAGGAAVRPLGSTRRWLLALLRRGGGDHAGVGSPPASGALAGDLGPGAVGGDAGVGAGIAGPFSADFINFAGGQCAGDSAGQSGGGAPGAGRCGFAVRRNIAIFSMAYEWLRAGTRVAEPFA